MKHRNRRSNSHQIDRALEATVRALAHAGLIRDTGERRNGQIVWMVTGKMERLKTLLESLQDNSARLHLLAGEVDRAALFESHPEPGTLRRWADTLDSIPDLLREAHAVTNNAINDVLTVLEQDEDAPRH